MLYSKETKKELLRVALTICDWCPTSGAEFYVTHPMSGEQLVLCSKCYEGGCNPYPSYEETCNDVASGVVNIGTNPELF